MQRSSATRVVSHISSPPRPAARRWTLAAVAAAIVGAAAGCQEVKEPTTTLTQAQWEEVKANILESPPDFEHPVGAKFGDKVELLGVDVEPDKLTAGKEATITWYWKALAPMDVNWQVFVHFDHHGDEPSRQGMDHHPVRDLYQTSRWTPGQIIKDEQKVRIRGDYPDGQAIFYVGLWNPANGDRLPVSNPDDVKHDNDNRVEALRIQVKGTRKKAKKVDSKPRVYLARKLAEGATINIDGKLDDEAWKRAARITLGGAGGGKSPAGVTRAQARWDDTHLYIGMWGDDPDVWGELDKRDADTWTQEVFEIFIDPDGDAKNYVELQVTPKNTIFDARFAEKLGRGTGSREEQIDAARAWNSDLESAVHIDGTLNKHDDRDKGWSAEIKLPLKDVPGDAPKVGDSWKVNFYRFDAPRDDSGKPQRQIAWAWSPARGSFHNVEHYGTLRFVGSKGLPAITAPGAAPPVPSPGSAATGGDEGEQDGVSAPGTATPDEPGAVAPDKPQ